jgi:ABC-type transporter Mla MlaB component
MKKTQAVAATAVRRQGDAMSVIEKCKLELDGVFDRAAALQLADALAWVKRGGEVEVDLTHVREFHDAGLAVLAQTIRQAGGDLRFSVKGLRTRQHRLLRYLGVELDAPAPQDASPLH